jgi:hypothetical protein
MVPELREVRDAETTEVGGCLHSDVTLEARIHRRFRKKRIPAPAERAF